MTRPLALGCGLVLLVVALGTGSVDTLSGTNAYYEPPINVIFTIHMEPFRPDPLDQRRQEYEARRQDLEYPLQWMEEYGLKPTVLGGGEFAEFCLDSGECGQDPPSGLFVDLMAQGIDMGTHWHRGYHRGPHDWPEVKNPDEETARRIVTDNREMVDRVVGAENNQAGNGIAHYPDMHAEQGFTMAPGLGETGESQFGHVVWNPWRPGEGPGFPEDFSSEYVAIPHLPQIGLVGGKPGSIHTSDLRLPYVKTSFLTIFLEWREHERRGDPDKVWVWGVAYQLNIRTDETHEQNPAFFQWLNENFINKTTPRGTPIARYASVSDVYNEFLAWEEAHPGVSSFHWQPGDPYPYSMPAMVQKIKGAAYEAEITTWQEQGVTVHRLSRDGTPVYVVYSDAGEQQIDFSSELSGRVQVTDGQGNGQTVDATALTVTEAPLFVEPAEAEAAAQTAARMAQAPNTLRIPHSAARLGNGHTLITGGGQLRVGTGSRIIEVTPEGEIAWEYDGLKLPYDADRLSNGNTLISAAPGGMIIEVDPEGTIVWQYPRERTGSLASTSESQKYLLVSYNANYLWGPPVRVGQADPEGFVTTLNRHLDLMERFGIKADYYFTGLAAEKLAEWSPQTLKRLLGSGHGINYHGANRPPYPQLIDQILGENWEEDVETAQVYEGEGTNPATGEHVGGIAAFHEVFGQDPFATGRFFEASILYVDKELGARMGVGLRDNTGADRNDAWFLGVLNRPEQAGLSASGLARAAIRGEDDEYLAHARAILTSIEGPFPVATLPIHDHDFYKHSPAEQEKVWDLYERALRLALELGFRPVTLRQIYAMVQNGPAPTISRDELLSVARSLTQTMESTGYPPEYVRMSQGAGVQGSGGAQGEACISLAEGFEGLVQALATYRQTGRLPATVETHDWLGPTAYLTGSVTVTTVSADAVLDAAVAVSATITDRIPSQVTVGGQSVNPAAFLYLMAQEYATIARGRPTSVALRPINLLPLAVAQNQEADALTKLQFWTYKPAAFAAELATISNVTRNQPAKMKENQP